MLKKKPLSVVRHNLRIRPGSLKKPCWGGNYHIGEFWEFYPGVAKWGDEAARDKGVKDVDAYLESLPAADREVVKELRKVIQKAAPEAEESFSYGLPAWEFNGKTLVFFAAFRKHCGFYPLDADLLEKFDPELRDYESSKGNIWFFPASPLQDELVKKIFKARLD